MAHLPQQFRFCTSRDGARIAYSTCGAGPLLIRTPQLVSHLQYDWDSVVWRHWLSLFASRHTLVSYDLRGCGLSIVKALNSRSKDTLRTWRRSPTPLASRSSPYSELRRVAPRRLHTLLGILIALPISFLLGATFVRTQARAQMTSNPTSKQLEEAEIDLKSARLAFEHDNPGMRQLYASIRMPDASPAHLRAYMDLMQVATTSANAVNLLRESFRIDIHDVAPKVRCPTIVFHARGDGVAPFNEGRSLAALIPGARFCRSKVAISA